MSFYVVGASSRAQWEKEWEKMQDALACAKFLNEGRKTAKNNEKTQLHNLDVVGISEIFEVLSEDDFLSHGFVFMRPMAKPDAELSGCACSRLKLSFMLLTMNKKKQT